MESKIIFGDMVKNKMKKIMMHLKCNTKNRTFYL